MITFFLSHPGIATWCENEVKGNKEDIACKDLLYCRFHTWFLLNFVRNQFSPLNTPTKILPLEIFVCYLTLSLQLMGA
jgi:hypothetical protein